MDTPAERIRLIEGSLRCFVFGCLSLLPVLGLVFGILAVLQAGLLPAQPPGDWNPGRRYALAGYALGWLGGLISLGILLAGAAPLIQQYLL
jgi:hypothetical protein